MILWPGAGAKVEPDVFQSITGFALQAYSCRGLVAALHHAILASRVPGNAIDHTVLAPIHVFLEFSVGRVVAVGHEVARRFPTHNVACGNRPRGAGQIAKSRNELQVDRGTKEGITLAPLRGIR